jgi:hypothetical protein
MQNKDWNQQEDPIFEKFNKLTIGKINQIEAIKSPEVRKKNSEALMGKIPSEETRKLWSIQRKNPKEETRIKMSESHKNPSEETRQKMAESHIGKKHSPETKAKMSETASNKKYAIYEGKEYSLNELSRMFNKTNRFFINVKRGHTKNKLNLIFI